MTSNTTPYFKNIYDQDHETQIPAKFFYSDKDTLIETTINRFVADYIEHKLKVDSRCKNGIGMIVFLELLEFNGLPNNDFDSFKAKYVPITIRYDYATKKLDYDVELYLFNHKEVLIMDMYHLIIDSNTSSKNSNL